MNMQMLIKFLDKHAKHRRYQFQYSIYTYIQCSISAGVWCETEALRVDSYY